MYQNLPKIFDFKCITSTVQHCVVRTKFGGSPFTNLVVKPKRATKKRSKLLDREYPVFRNAKNSQLIISCKRPEFNHYKENLYGNSPNEQIDLKYLASGGWMHSKAKGDYFTVNSFSKPHHFSPFTFDQLGLDEKICKLLKKQSLRRASIVQAATIPEVLALKNVICAAETGSGKTLAYLLPLIQQLLVYKTIEYQPVTYSTARAVILVPSKELVDQISGVARELCDPLELNVQSLVADNKAYGTIASMKAKRRDIDILVTTPNCLSLMIRNKGLSQNFISHLVIDEADTLTDASFGNATSHALSQISMKQTGIAGTQIILASATYPNDVRKSLSEVLDVNGFANCSTARLHGVLGNITQKFYRVPSADKPEFLLTVTKDITERVPTMIFANKCSTAYFLHKYLTDNNSPNLLLTGHMEGQERAECYQKFKSLDYSTLVCSDIASRGLDTLHIGSVINYDFPMYISDYIHRAGRLGRIGSKHSGRLYNLIGRKPEVPNVWLIERALRSSSDIAELVGVNANIKHQLQEHRSKLELEQQIREQRRLYKSKI